MESEKEKILQNNGYHFENDAYIRKAICGNYVQVRRKEKEEYDINWLKNKITKHQEILGAII
jgi:hypothetical protein